ncbi:hypothetical protein GF345_02040 [Candidatus Woesearchaeota archaeon]|nr:hypothetical protein [Candidatus Woesearchaeota archaeon]
MKEKRGMRKAGIISLMLFMLVILASSNAYSLEKPVEGYVYDGTGPVDQASITIFMQFDQDGKKITCISYPQIKTDERGYFITNLGNLRVLGNNQQCEDRWSEGDVLGVIADSRFTKLPDRSDPVISSESGSSLMLKRLLLTEEVFNPVLSELSLARMSIRSVKETISWESDKVFFDSEIYNPNNVPIENAYLRIVVTEKEDKNSIIDIIEKKFSMDLLESRHIQLNWNIKDIEYGSYSYNVVVYTDTETHDRILDRIIDIKPLLGLLSTKNLIIAALIIIIIMLSIMLLKSRKKNAKSKK